MRTLTCDEVIGQAWSALLNGSRGSKEAAIAGGHLVELARLLDEREQREADRPLPVRSRQETA